MYNIDLSFFPFIFVKSDFREEDCVAASIARR